MNKVLYFFLCIFTLGIFAIYIHKKAHKYTNVQTSTKFNFTNFYNTVLGPKNIISVSCTSTALICILKEKVSIDKEKLSSLKIKGCSISNNKYIFLIGNDAQVICDKIKQDICSS